MSNSSDTIAQPASAPSLSALPPPDPMSQNVPKCPISDESQAETENPNLDSLSESQLAALDMILTGATYQSISQSLGIDRRTLYRWRTAHPHFRRALDQRRRSLCEDTADRFRANLSKALSIITTQLDDPYTATSLRAARTLLTLASIGKLLYPELPIPDDTNRSPTDDPKGAVKP